MPGSNDPGLDAYNAMVMKDIMTPELVERLRKQQDKVPDRVIDAPIPEKLNCYGLTGKQWDDVCQASSDIHLKLIEVEPGEDAFDEESLILSKGLSALYLTAIARLEAEKQAAHAEGWNAASEAACERMRELGRPVNCIFAVRSLSKATAAKPEPSPSSATQGDPSDGLCPHGEYLQAHCAKCDQPSPSSANRAEGRQQQDVCVDCGASDVHPCRYDKDRRLFCDGCCPGRGKRRRAAQPVGTAKAPESEKEGEL